LILLSSPHPFAFIACFVMLSQMPGMNGYEVCKELRKHYSSALLPIIMVSAKTADEDVVQVRVYPCGRQGPLSPAVRMYVFQCSPQLEYVPAQVSTLHGQGGFKPSAAS
jgi:CheY-like chemotaxis protein